MLVDEKGKQGTMGARRSVGILVGYSTKTSSVRVRNPHMIMMGMIIFFHVCFCALWSHGTGYPTSEYMRVPIIKYGADYGCDKCSHTISHVGITHNN